MRKIVRVRKRKRKRKKDRVGGERERVKKIDTERER